MPNPAIEPTRTRRKKAANGEPMRFLREVAAIHDGDGCLTFPYARSRGYGEVGNRGAHRVVCEIVHGKPPTPDHEAAHSCGNGHLGCVSGAHLRWATFAENRADMINHGRSCRGGKANFNKLTENDVREVRMLSEYLSQRKIAAMFNISQPAVRYILNGQNWGWLA